MRGLPRAYIKKYGVTKRAWAEYRKANKHPTTRKRPNTRVSKVPKRRRTYTRKRKRQTKDKRLPILTLAGIAAMASKPIENAVNGDYMGALAELGSRTTGYNFQSKVFDWKYALMNGWVPIIAGAIGSKVATKLGVNRTMKKIPFLGKYIKL